MRRICHRTMPAFWALLLFVLAVSPVTAPFSSFDLKIFFSDRDVHPGAILQSKGVQDKTVAGPASVFMPGVVHASAPGLPVSPAVTPHGCSDRHFPLRI